MSPLLAGTHVVLLRPRWARNLGAVARAMKNFGLQRLSIVDSRIGSWTDAWEMAVKAGDVLEQAERTDDLAHALRDGRWVVGTTNRPLAGARLLTPREVAAAARENGPPTLLFGGEVNGLQPAELLRCHALSTIPTASEQSSLNLAQAVCVYAAELFAAHGDVDVAALARAPAAPSGLLHQLERALERTLASSAFADADRGKHAIAELLQPWFRAGLTEDEVRAWLTALGKVVQAPRRARD